MSTAANSRPFTIAPGDGEVLVPGRARLVISGRQTADAFEVIELSGPEGDGPPPHIHDGRSELFYVLEGSVEFILGEDTVLAEAGSLVFVPRNTRHGFRLGPSGRMLAVIEPAGLEGFFRDLGAGMAAGKSHLEVRGTLEGKYDQRPA